MLYEGRDVSGGDRENVAKGVGSNISIGNLGLGMKKPLRLDLKDEKKKVKKLTKLFK